MSRSLYIATCGECKRKLEVYAKDWNAIVKNLHDTGWARKLRKEKIQWLCPAHR